MDNNYYNNIYNFDINIQLRFSQGEEDKEKEVRMHSRY